MKKARLPAQLEYTPCTDLIRIGSERDGGYLISKSDLQNTQVLLSFGIEADWRFEEAFQNMSNADVIAYDASTNMKRFWQGVSKYFCRLDPIGVARWFKKMIDYRRFFQGRNQLRQYFVGLGQTRGFVSFRDAFEATGSDRVFVKMDIEGWEYRCLDDMVALQDRMSGLAIEFHDVDLHLERIIRFIEVFELPVAHVHANNFAPLNDEGVPLTIEVTFSRYGQFDSSSTLVLPHPLDNVNDPASEEIQIIFEQS